MSIYKSYSPEDLEELFSNFLVDSWSYSKVSSFARNEKSFEMQYIFGLYGRNSATQVAGSSYHEALEYYFNQKKSGKEADIIELEQVAFAYIDDIKPNYWKIQKTTPTVEDCQKKAYEIATKLIRNFYGEKAEYESDLAEIIDVEMYIDEFLTVNGVDIPLPAHMKIDMVIRTKEGKLVIIDHKSKSTFTPDEEATLTIGVQAITYVLGYEAKTGAKVDEVWFIENKYSKNKDNSAQLWKIPVVIDQNTRRLYEALLYEPLQRMIKAVSDPDYCYLINDMDNLTDKAELYDFWARTMISEVEDFNVEESKKELVSKRLKKIRDSSLSVIPPSTFRTFSQKASSFIQYDISNANMTNEEKIEHTLRTLGMIVKVAHTFEGYSSNTYLIEVSAGVKVGAIYSKRLDIANALNVTNVRISNQLVVHENKSYISVDFSKKRDKDLIFDPSELHGLKIPLGKDNFGQTIIWDIENPTTPHMLVCGGTGSGKTAFIISIMEYAKLSRVQNIIIFDPKYDKEFKHYNNSHNFIVCNEIEDIELKAMMLVEKMNELVRTGKTEYTLIIVDEFADAVSNSMSSKEAKKIGFKTLEENMRLIVQKGRSVGFRVITSTQRASTKVITGDAKVNYPIQVCFRVQKEADSRVVLDEPGAESLAGKGDGLIKSPEYPDTIRFQAFYNPKFQTA